MPDPIRIAAIAANTGPLSTYGAMLAGGAEAAVHRINAEGGIKGTRLECVAYDDAGAPDRAAAAAAAAARDGVRFVVGHTISDCALSAAQVYDASGLLLVTPGATLPELTARGFRRVFRTIGANSAQGGAAGRFIADRAPGAVVLVHDGRAYGRSLVEAVQAALRERSIAPLRIATVSSGATDFSALVGELADLEADFVFYGGYPPELGRLIRQARAAGLAARFVAGAACDSGETARHAGEAAMAQGLLVSAPAAFERDPANSAVVRALRERGTDPGNPYTMPAYAAVQLLAHALRAAGPAADTTVVAEAIRAGSFPTVIGDLRYDPNGDLTRAPYHVYQWHPDRPKVLALGG